VADVFDELERYLKADVARHHRHGIADYTFEEALKGHRRQVLENLHDDGDPAWLARNGLLEQLAEKRGVQLYGEPEVKAVLEYRRDLEADRRKARA
jgi:hypothetical protein